MLFVKAIHRSISSLFWTKKATSKGALRYWIAQLDAITLTLTFSWRVSWISSLWFRSTSPSLTWHLTRISSASIHSRKMHQTIMWMSWRVLARLLASMRNSCLLMELEAGLCKEKAHHALHYFLFQVISWIPLLRHKKSSCSVMRVHSNRVR